ncbi:hypothetical protein HK101_008526 [Irineochytrium annulatum]|nr:hypothetical protein HK101_008526 [Irineochytrium annulatum]
MLSRTRKVDDREPENDEDDGPAPQVIGPYHWTHQLTSYRVLAVVGVGVLILLFSTLSDLVFVATALQANLFGPDAISFFTAADPTTPPPGNASALQRVPGELLWPRPRSFTHGNDTVSIDPWSLTATFPGRDSARVRAALTRLPATFDRIACRADSSPAVITFILEAGDDAAPLHSADEGYTLNVTAAGKIVIESREPWGAIRALETLHQLLTPRTPAPLEAFLQTDACASLRTTTGYNPGLEVRHAPWSIRDAPAYTHRGLLVDTSRHYLSVAALKRTVDGLAMAKMNVLHWHAVDSQSFPFVSERVEGFMKAEGAYSRWQVYTRGDVEAVVRYAEDRGVRVIVEMDVPGHAGAWGAGSEGLVVCADKREDWFNYCAEPPCGQLDISKPATVTTVTSLLTEISSWLIDPILHLGTDEVNERCYAETLPVLLTGKTSFKQLVSTFVLNLHSSLRAAGKRVGHWEEAVLEYGGDATFDRERVLVQAWKGVASVGNLVKLGFEVVNSFNGAYYLDCGAGSFVSGGKSWCDPFKTWQVIYGHDAAEGVAASAADGGGKVVGLEVMMWGEQTDDTNLDAKVWPRAAAAGESVWSFDDSSQKSWVEALPRLMKMRDRLLRRGVAASPVQPEWCGANGPDACLLLQ